MSLYTPQQKAECKLMFIQQGKSAWEISKHFGGKPSVQTILNWTKKKNSDDLTWEAEKEQFEQHSYEKLSPQNLAEKILKRIEMILLESPKSFTTKDADALAKLQKVMEKLIDKKFQIPTMYHVLTRLLEFLSLHYKTLLCPELINAVRHFKNVLKEEME